MISSYMVEKWIKEKSRAERSSREERAWIRWRQQQSDEWVSNYRRRIEKFVVDVPSQLIAFP